MTRWSKGTHERPLQVRDKYLTEYLWGWTAGKGGLEVIGCKLLFENVDLGIGILERWISLGMDEIGMCGQGI